MSSAAAGEGKKSPGKFWEFERRCWKLYFEETTAETAPQPVRRGIQPTVDAVTDTRDHPFITEPVLAMVRPRCGWGGVCFSDLLLLARQVHQVHEMQKENPVSQFLDDYFRETDRARKAKMRVKVFKLLGLPPADPNAPHLSEEKKRKFTLQYPFVSDLKKIVEQGQQGSAVQKKE